MGCIEKTFVLGTNMVLKMEMAAQLGDIRKLFHFLNKVTITRGTVNEMIQDRNGEPVKAIKDRVIKWKES